MYTHIYMYIYIHTYIHACIHTHGKSTLLNSFALHQLVYSLTPAILPWNILGDAQSSYICTAGRLSDSTRHFWSHQVNCIFTKSQLNLFPNLVMFILQ